MAAKFAGCALIAAALTPASAIRSRTVSNATIGCEYDKLFTTVQDFVNGKIAERIGNKETHHFDLVSFDKEINLFRCSGGLTMSTGLTVTKLSTANMDDLQCINEKCLDGAGSSCKKALYDIDIGIEFGTIGVAGTNVIDLDLCVAGAGKDVAMDFAIQAPSINIKVQIEETSNGIAKIPSLKFKQVYGLDFNMGAITTTRNTSSSEVDCQFDRLPKFKNIRSHMEGWCEQAVEWTARKLMTTAILGATTDLFMSLLNVVFKGRAPRAARVGKKSKGAAKGKGSALAEKDAKEV